MILLILPHLGVLPFHLSNGANSFCQRRCALLEPASVLGHPPGASPQDPELLSLGTLPHNLHDPLVPVCRPRLAVRPDHAPQRTNDVLAVQLLEALGRADSSCERRAGLGDAPGILGVGLGPLELLAEVREVHLNGDVVLPRHEVVVYPVSRRRDVVEEQAGEGELLDGT